MQDFFDNDASDPSGGAAGEDTLAEAGYEVGMAGPVTTSFCGESVEWHFVPNGSSSPASPPA